MQSPESSLNHFLSSAKKSLDEGKTVEEIRESLSDVDKDLFERLYRIPRKNILEFISSVISSHQIESPFLDIGCGNQEYVTQVLQETGKDVQYIGVDHFLHPQTPSKDNFVIADAHMLPIPNSAVKTILCSEVLEHVTDDRLVISEIARVICPGGTLIMTIPGKDIPKHEKPPFQIDYRRYSQSQLLDLLVGYFVVEEISSRRVYEFETNIFILAHKPLP